MTYAEAKDELLGTVNRAIVAAAPNTVGQCDVYWPGMPIIAPPDVDKHWVRVFYTTVRDIQASLAKLNGVSRYEALGQLLVMVKSPMSVVGSQENGNALAEEIRNAFRIQSPSGVMTYTNQLIREVGADDTHFQTNVIVTCTYDNFQ